MHFGAGKDFGTAKNAFLGSLRLSAKWDTDRAKQSSELRKNAFEFRCLETFV